MDNQTRLIQLVELAGSHARRILIDGQQELMPTWVLIDRGGRMQILGTPWKNQLEKDLTARMLRHKMREDDVVMYSCVIEAYAATKPKDWTPNKLNDPDYVAPRDDPARREIVVAFATDGEFQEWRTWTLVRDWNERMIDLQLEKPATEHQGWMADLLAKKGSKK
jgi:hypothetical protein